MRTSIQRVQELAALWRRLAALGEPSSRRQRLAWADELEQRALSRTGTADASCPSMPSHETGRLTGRIAELIGQTETLCGAATKLLYRTATNVEISRQCAAELKAKLREARQLRRGGGLGIAMRRPQ